MSGFETKMQPDSTTAENGHPAGESRALVVVTPQRSEPVQPPPPRRPANFLAHLIATKTQMPQTRLRRRAEPAEALAAYRAVASSLRR
jgi:hypothetical protein